MFAYVTGGLTDFVNKVVPQMQRRGIFRQDYEGRTLREHLGLPRPPNRFFARKGQTSKRPPNDGSAIQGYHAHVYYSQQTRAIAERLREQIDGRYQVKLSAGTMRRSARTPRPCTRLCSPPRTSPPWCPG